MAKFEPTEIHRKYRPTKLEDVVGQAAAVKTLKSFKAVPHVLLFTGFPGTGKTTLARIMAERVGCDVTNKFDYTEVNCGIVDSPIELTREMESRQHQAPWAGSAIVWVLDEVQSWARARFAQESLLKILEETPRHVYYFLCTTDPKKIIAAVRSRCTEIAVKPIPPKELRALLVDVAGREGAKISADVLDKIVENANGSARGALVLLGKAIGITDPDEQMAAIGAGSAETETFELVKVLMPFRGRPNWGGVAAVLKKIEDAEPEAVRRLLLAIARKILLDPKDSGRWGLAYLVADCFRDPFYDESAGKTLLVSKCYEVCVQAPK